MSLPLPVARAIASAIKRRLEDGCEVIEIAGSIRRQAPEVGDIELVAIPNGKLDACLEHLMTTEDPNEPRIYRFRTVLENDLKAQGTPFVSGPDIPRWGKRYKRFYLWSGTAYGIVAVDLFLADRQNWGAILTIRTGPSDFSRAMVTRLKTFTRYLQKGGYVVDKHTGDVVPVPTEDIYFALAKVPYIPPEERTVTRLAQVALEANRQTREQRRLR